MVTFSSNAWHNFAKGKVIFKCKNDKPWKTEIGKMSPCPPCTILPPPFFNFSDSPPPPSSGAGNQNLLSPPLKKGRCPNYGRSGLKTLFHGDCWLWQYILVVQMSYICVKIFFASWHGLKTFCSFYYQTSLTVRLKNMISSKQKFPIFQMRFTPQVKLSYKLCD